MTRFVSLVAFVRVLGACAFGFGIVGCAANLDAEGSEANSESLCTSSRLELLDLADGVDDESTSASGAQRRTQESVASRIRRSIDRLNRCLVSDQQRCESFANAALASKDAGESVSSDVQSLIDESCGAYLDELAPNLNLRVPDLAAEALLPETERNVQNCSRGNAFIAQLACSKMGRGDAVGCLETRTIVGFVLSNFQCVHPH